MLPNVHLTLLTPQTPAELASALPAFRFLHHFAPQHAQTALEAFLEANIPNNTLVYANDILIGCFMLDVHERSVEIHGVARPDMAEVIPGAKKVKLEVFRIMLDACFHTLGKEKVIIKAPDSNRGVVGFARMYGFERLKYLDKGDTVWKLHRNKYERAMSGQQETQG